MKIEEFCKKHNACNEGRKWALACGAKNMQELWDRDDLKPEWRIWVATRPGVLPERELRLFAVDCARRALRRLPIPDKRSLDACDVAERYALGMASIEELYSARYAAANAAYSATRYDAAYAAYSAAAWSADADAEWSDERKLQVEYMLAMFRPSFVEGQK